MRHGAGAAILDARTIDTVYIGEVPTAILAQAIQRAKAEQAAVSYTHLDVYKRQLLVYLLASAGCFVSLGVLLASLGLNPT